MGRRRRTKRGKGRVYTKLNAMATAHAAEKNVEPVIKADLTREIASYGNDFAAQTVTGGIVPNPDDIMMIVAPGKLGQYQQLGTDPYKLHRIMRRSDLKYKSLIKTRKNGVLSKDWRVVPNPNDHDVERATKVSDFVAAALDYLSNFDSDLEELLDAIPLGFAVSEVMWTQTRLSFGDGYVMDAWIPEDIRQRRQGRFDFAEDGSLRYQEAAGRYVEVPRGKFIVHTHAKENEGPHGTPEAAEVFWSWWMKHHFVKWWAIFGEKFGMPTAVAKYPTNWDADKRRALLSVLAKIQTEFGVVVPQGADLEFIESQRSGSINTYESFAEWCDKNMSEALTGQSLATGQGQSGTGSYAQSRSHADVKQEYTDADCKALMATINTQLVDMLVEVNFGADVPSPRWVIEYEAVDLAADLELDIKLVNDVGLSLPAHYFYSKYKRPVPTEDEPVVKGRTVAAPSWPGTPPGSQPPRPPEKGGDEDAEDVDGDDPDVADENDDETASHGRRPDPAGHKCHHQAQSGITRHAANDEDLNRRLEEYESLEAELVSSASEVYGAFGDAILDEVSSASGLADARERLQRLAAGYEWRDRIAEQLTKAKLNAYLVAAAQVQRYAAEISDEDGNVDVSLSMSRRWRSFNLTELLAAYEPLDPDEALKWYEDLVPLPKSELDNLPQQAATASVTIADVESKDLLSKVQDLISEFLSSGRTQREFVEEYQKLRVSYGLDAAENHQAEQLFRTEMGRAYGAGRNRALTDPEIEGAFPLWEYVAIMDDRTRPEHAAMDGFVAAPDDPVWLSKSPPWDYNCRCDIVPLTRRQIETRGVVEKGTVTMPDGSEVDPRSWPTSPGFRGLGF